MVIPPPFVTKFTKGTLARLQHNVLHQQADNLRGVALTRNLNVRLDDDLRGGIDAVCQRDGPDVSIADIVRRALREFLERELGQGWQDRGVGAAPGEGQ